MNAVLAGAPNPAGENAADPRSARRRARRITASASTTTRPGRRCGPTCWRPPNNTEVATAWEWPTHEEFKRADVIVFFQHGDWNDQRAADIDAFLERGGGLVYVHWASMAARHGARIRQAHRPGWDKALAFRHGEMDLAFNRDSKHPIMRNFDTLNLDDEAIGNWPAHCPPAIVLATAVEDGEPQPLFWALEPGKGRVFVSIPGHFSWTFDDPLFRILLLRGIAWAAHEPVDRFNDLVWLGADR